MSAIVKNRPLHHHYACLIVLLFCLCQYAPVHAVTTVTLQNGSPYFGGIYDGAEDTYLREAYPDAAPGYRERMAVGYDTDAPGGAARVLIRFNLSSVRENMDSAGTIAGARLHVWMANNGKQTYTDVPVNLYAVSEANKGWAAGTNESASTSEAMAACWNYRVYDPTFTAPDNQECGLCPRHEAWAGTRGCGGIGTDYSTPPLATATVSSTDAGSWIVFEITDCAGLNAALNDHSTNAGFLVMSASMEHDELPCILSSAEHEKTSLRPKLELDIELSVTTQQAIVFTYPTGGRVSALIQSNETKRVVKELLHGATRPGGKSFELWNCKDDPISYGDSAEIVPDGDYTVRYLITQGLTAEWMLTLGTTTPGYRKWPGNHVGIRAVAVDETGVYAGSPTSEVPVAWLKMTTEGETLFDTEKHKGIPGQHVIQFAVDGDTLWILDKDGNLRAHGRHSLGWIGSRIVAMPEDSFYTGDTWHGGLDMAVSNKRMILASIAARASGEHVDTTGKIRWFNTADGTFSAPIDVPGAMGVGMDRNGNGLVAVGNEIRRYEFYANSYSVLIHDSLNSPYRIDVNPENGDIYVAEGGDFWTTDNQVKRFDEDGAWCQTYGKPGGRPAEGAYNPNDGFRDIADLAVAADGSFWICEHTHAPRRLAHYAKDGTIINEWYGGQVYATHAVPVPGDPTEVWIDCRGDQIIRGRVDWVNRSWGVDGNYSLSKGLVEGTWWNEEERSFTFLTKKSGTSPRFFPRSRNGITYLYHEKMPGVLIVDPRGDSLRAVSYAGAGHRSCDCWWKLPPSLCPPGTEQEQRNNPDGNRYNMYSWFDKNTDGLVTYDEMSWPANEDAGFEIWNGHGHFVCPIDEEGNYYGGFKHSHPGVNKDRDGVHAGPYVIPVTWKKDGAGMDVPTYNWADKQKPYDSIPQDIDYHEMIGAALDNEGNLFAAYNYEKCRSGYGDPGECKGGGTGAFSSMFRKIGGNRVMKWDTTGSLRWDVGRHTYTGSPQEGEANLFCRMLGSVRGCVVISDIRHHNYIWDEDGLWVGSTWDNIDPATKSLPDWQTLLWQRCEEVFGGMIYEVPDNSTPGLHKGDVLFFSAGWNTSEVWKIKGWDQFVRGTKTITVRDGAIVSQSDCILSTPHASPRPRAIPLSLSTHITGRGMEIRFTLPAASRVSLSVYNALGREVQRLMERQPVNAGTHTVCWYNLDNRTPVGFYFLRLTDEKRTAFDKIMFIH